MRSKMNMASYAPFTTLSRSQFNQICPRQNPLNNFTDPVQVARMKDGSYWVKWQGDTCFWASRWYEIPKTVGQRAERIQEFVDNL